MMTFYKSRRRCFIRVPGVRQCVRDEGEPLRGDSLHGGQQQDGGQPGPGGRAHLRLERQAAGQNLIFGSDFIICLGLVYCDHVTSYWS